MLRLNLQRPVGRASAGTIDIHEFYWAGMVQGRISLRNVLGWIARTSLTPLRYWAQQSTVLFREGGRNAKRLPIFLRELLRAAMLIAVAALLLLPFVYAAAEASTVRAALQDLWGSLRSVDRPVGLVSWLALLFFASMILRGWLQLIVQRVKYRTRLKGQVAMERRAARWWLIASVVAFVALAAAAWALHWRLQLGVPGLIGRIAAALQPRPVFLPLLALAVAFVLRWPLVKFVGDIALYVTADSRSSRFRTRDEILARSTDLLRGLLAAGDYDAVYVAGHSLGSVIAYDTINRLTREVRAADTDGARLDGHGFDQLKGLLTFGSPLDKVYYFFRTRVKDEEPIRAQLLSSLHGFRRGRSGRDYGDLQLDPYEMPEPEGFRWHNVFSRMDRVSGHLDFYEVDRQIHRAYWNPITAHLDYWNDARFYDAVVEWL